MIKNMFTRKVLACNVQDKTYLFGGPGIESPLNNNLTMLIRVDEHGEPVTLYTNMTKASTPFIVGILEPGQMFAIPLNQLVSVHATADHDSSIEITLLTHQRT